MRKFAIIATVMSLLFVGVAQQQQPEPKPQQPTANTNSNQTPSGGTPPPQYPAPKRPGTFKAEGRPLSFFARGEGRLTFSGRGYVVIHVPQDNSLKIQVSGFQEVKELPRNVRLKPPIDKRIRVFQGQGTITVEGKFDSIRVVLRQGSLDFRGIAAFNVGGIGKAFLDGQERQLSATGTFTYLVPEPEWQKQDDVKVAPNPRQQ